MFVFITGLIVFFGAHGATTLARGARGSITSRIGEGAYKGFFSLTAAIGLVMIIVGWRGADASLIYAPPLWMRHITYLLMLLALVLLASAYLPAGRIAAAAKHPMLAGVKLWAFGHLLANGEVRSVMLFGLFLAYAVVARIAAKKRGTPTRPAGPIINDAYALGAGLAAWLAIYFFLHPYLAGVALTS